jgi:hypothetical protein
VKERHGFLKERMARQRAEKSSWERGQWNVQSVTLGGLGFNPAMIDAVDTQAEINKQDVQDDQSVPTHGQAVQQMQTQLDVVWASLRMPTKQKLDMVIKYNSTNFLEEIESTWSDMAKSRRRLQRNAGPKGKLNHRIMADLTAMGDALDSAVQQWVSAAENILLRESIMQKLEVFERDASDPARHGARFSAEIYTRGCHWIPRMFA